MYLIHKNQLQKFVIFGGVKALSFYFKQLPLNIKQKSEFSYQ